MCLLCFLRNWYVDEPSCGSEICVVMYHQPSAPPGVGGPYMFQWNDDRCNMKNNFICKYSLGNESFCFKKQPAPSSQEEVWGDHGIDVKTISVSSICRYLPCNLWILRFLKNIWDFKWSLRGREHKKGACLDNILYTWCPYSNLQETYLFFFFSSREANNCSNWELSKRSVTDTCLVQC